MKRISAALAVAAVAGIVGVSVLPPERLLVWNSTASAPKGLYFVGGGVFESGAWVMISGDAPSAKWIAENGFLARGWPVIKRVAAVEGDEICRDGDQVFINGIHAATALKTDGAGRELPRWHGCFSIQANERFLLNDHPRSLDGRYFGVTKRADIIGVARLIIRVD